MAVSILLVAVLPALLIAAAMWDLTSFTIPNALVLSLLVAFIVFIGAAALGGEALSWNDAGLHVLAGIVGLAAGMGLFAAGWVGGGDAKLFAVAALWLGWNTMFEYTLLASFLGGILTLAVLALRRVPLPKILRHDWVLHLADQDAGVPYGIALALAALFALPHSELFRLAAGN